METSATWTLTDNLSMKFLTI